jgi:hypothetical protein
MRLLCDGIIPVEPVLYRRPDRPDTAQIIHDDVDLVVLPFPIVDAVKEFVTTGGWDF